MALKYHYKRDLKMISMVDENDHQVSTNHLFDLCMRMPCGWKVGSFISMVDENDHQGSTNHLFNLCTRMPCGWKVGPFSLLPSLQLQLDSLRAHPEDPSNDHTNTSTLQKGR